jgi:hypothetical protein
VSALAGQETADSAAVADWRVDDLIVELATPDDEDAPAGKAPAAGRVSGCLGWQRPD